MSVLDHLDNVLRAAEEQGSWAEYAVYTLGEVHSGDEELDAAIAELYRANEAVHRIANKLSLRYELDFFEGK